MPVVLTVTEGLSFIPDHGGHLPLRPPPRFTRGPSDPHAVRMRALLAFALCASASLAFRPVGPRRSPRGGARLAATMSAEARISEMVESNRIMLFMKGNKMFPQCGFSNTAVAILQRLECEFETFDVLSDEEIRSGVKEFSMWPTIPQLYVDGEFVGGCDVMLEQYESGELQKVLAASPEEAEAMPAPEVQAKQQELKDAAARGDMNAVLTLTNELLELEGAPEGQSMGGGGTNIVGGAR